MSEATEVEQHRTERHSHAIYGLIIITSTLVADRASADDALQSLLVLWGAGVVLVLAHVYSATLAEVGERGRFLTYGERYVMVADNLAVLAAVALPTLLLIAAGIGWLTLELALDLAVVTSILALFVVGVRQARRHGAGLKVQVGLGALGGVIGIVVVMLEVVLSH